MTFYIGQKSAGEIFLGEKKIGRLYLGQTLIHMTKVVSKPTFLEYIESDGNSWINTGVYGNQNTKIETEVLISAKNSDGFIYGSRVSALERAFTCSINSLNGIAYAGFGFYNNGGSVVLPNPTKDKITTVHSVDGFFINGEKKLYIQPSNDFTTPTPITLLALSLQGSMDARTFKGRMYGCKMYENEVLLRDFRPCIDPKGVVCLYDTVTKTYFYNQGTGELKAGEPLAEHEELEYLEFDGTQCIDTGLYPNSNMRVESTFMYKGHTEPVGEFVPSRGMYGAKGSGSYIALYSDGYQKWGGVNSVYMDVSVFKDKKVNAVQDKNGVVVDGVLYEYTSVPEDFVNTTNTFLIGDTNGSSARPFIGKMYGLKLYENNVLLRDFVPVKRSDGVKCMYDRVENKYYELKEA